MSGLSLPETEPPFLGLGVCLGWESMAEHQRVSSVARGEGQPEGFLRVYERVHGQVRRLPPDVRIQRRGFLARHWRQIEDNEGGRLWVEQGLYEGLPTRHALALVMWAWHPDPRALRQAFRRWETLASDHGWL